MMADASVRARFHIPAEARNAHDRAVKAGSDTYIDPATGYSVFTEEAHVKRGTCCGNACRHCPFAHAAVPTKYKINRPIPRIAKPTFIPFDAVTVKSIKKQSRESRRLKSRHARGKIDDDVHEKANSDVGLAVSEGVDCLFWSGGKDSYLALKHLQIDKEKEQLNALTDRITNVDTSRDAGGDASSIRSVNRIVLVTTINVATWEASHQSVGVDSILGQAKFLKLDVLLIPLADFVSNEEYKSIVDNGLETLSKAGLKPDRLVFGDLRLAEVRDWRISVFGKDYECIFPNFGRSKKELLQMLWRSKDISVRVVSTPQGTFDGKIEEGCTYDERCVANLPEFVDAMGEGGEFQTEVIFASRLDEKPEIF
eukprot:CFRG7158T1